MENKYDAIKNNLTENERNKTIIEVATQVSHDIRSPLSALTFLLNDIDSLPEEKRILIRSSVNRISDIANSLLSKNKIINNDFHNTKLESTMLWCDPRKVDG